jgi:hypothetical protein
MPVTIPPGTKFEAIKSTTAVNRRSALVNANDLTYTIEDIAAAAGGTFPITNNYIPRANSSGSIVDSSLYEFVDPLNNKALYGNYNNGIGIFSSGGSVNLFQVDNVSRYIYAGDIFGVVDPAWGISFDCSTLGSEFLNFYMNGISRLNFDLFIGSYNFGGATTKFGIINADLPQSSLSVSTDLVVDIAGTKYIKVDVNGTVYNIELVP